MNTVGEREGQRHPHRDNKTGGHQRILVSRAARCCATSPEVSSHTEAAVVKPTGPSCAGPRNVRASHTSGGRCLHPSPSVETRSCPVSDAVAGLEHRQRGRDGLGHREPPRTTSGSAAGTSAIASAASASTATRPVVHGPSVRTTRWSIPAAPRARARVTNVSALSSAWSRVLTVFVISSNRRRSVARVVREHRQLVSDLGAAIGNVEEVAGVAVTGNEPEGLGFTGAADQDRRVRTRHRFRTADRSPRGQATTHEGGCVAGPHVVGELDGVREPLEPLDRRRQRHAEIVGLLLEVAGTDPEPSPTLRQRVNVVTALISNAAGRIVAAATIAPSRIRFVCAARKPRVVNVSSIGS